MLTVDDARMIIWDITYKPGWAFNTDVWEATGGRFPSLKITANVLHSETLQPVEFIIKRFIPRAALDSEEMLVGWVEDMCHEAEFHELREFFRYKGQLWDNPHESTPARSTS